MNNVTNAISNDIVKSSGNWALILPAPHEWLMNKKNKDIYKAMCTSYAVQTNKKADWISIGKDLGTHNFLDEVPRI